MSCSGCSALHGVNPNEKKKRNYQTSCSVHKFLLISNEKPLPIISIKTIKALTQTLLEKGVYIFDKTHFCEACKQPVVHCFNCQRFDHRATNCLLESACENCVKLSPNYFKLCQLPREPQILFKDLPNLYYSF